MDSPPKSDDKSQKSIKAFAEYLHNLRAVNLYITLPTSYCNPVPLLSISQNIITISTCSNLQLILDSINLENCSSLPPRCTIDSSTNYSNSYCYRLVVKPLLAQHGSAAAEVVENFTKIVDQGAKQLIRNSLNPVALREHTNYLLSCRFCKGVLGEGLNFARIRPLPSKNWVENASELWYCHPPSSSSNSTSSTPQGDVAERLNKISLASQSESKSILELITNPEVNYLFYGPCNWALNKANVKNIVKSSSPECSPVIRANCGTCSSELGSFTSEQCVKLWDFGVEWLEAGQTSPSPPSSSSSQNISSKALQNFKSIIFATIYELSDHPTFRFTASSIYRGNSVFLWNIDRNLVVFPEKSVPLGNNFDKEVVIVKLEQVRVAKFFYAVKTNNLLEIREPKEIALVQETEQNPENVLTIPDYIYKAGISSLRLSGKMYGRNEGGNMQCGFLQYDV